MRLTLIFLTISVGLVACGTPRAATTTVNAAALPSEPAPSAEEPAPAAAPPRARENPPGQLVCSTTRTLAGTTELWLEWVGPEAIGTLRTTAPSGLVHEQKVRAERYEGKVIVDDVASTDVAVHTAVLKGKRILLGDDETPDWSTCD